MAHFFSYDDSLYKHRIFGIEVKNEKDELLGYRPLVERNPKSGGLVENVSELFPNLKWKVFSTEKLARDFAIDFFINLKKDDWIKARMRNGKTIVI
jgi:hypothetical protein